MEDWQTFLTRIYFDSKQPGAFAGPLKLQKILKQNNYIIKLKDIKVWLQEHDAYTLLRPTRYKFKRRRIVTTGIDDLWDADLADVSNIAQHNDGMRYWLVAIDLFSRHVWVVPVLSKHHTHILQAFHTLFQQTPRRPKNLRTDKGSEFINRAVKKLMKNMNINAYTTKNETKANYAERVIRTLKGLMYRYFHHTQTYTYTDVLQNLVDNYNQRPHSSLEGLAPSQITQRNEAKVWKAMYMDTVRKRRRRPYAFSIGDYVRISHLKYTFQRDYHQKWTEEIFKVTRRLRKEDFNLYTIRDWMDEAIDGYFYEEELQLVTKDPDTAFRIEHVLKQRRRRGQQELFVKWLGWPKKFNSWVNQTDVQRL